MITRRGGYEHQCEMEVIYSAEKKLNKLMTIHGHLQSEIK